MSSHMTIVRASPLPSEPQMRKLPASTMLPMLVDERLWTR